MTTRFSFQPLNDTKHPEPPGQSIKAWTPIINVLPGNVKAWKGCTQIFRDNEPRKTRKIVNSVSSVCSVVISGREEGRRGNPRPTYFLFSHTKTQSVCGSTTNKIFKFKILSRGTSSRTSCLRARIMNWNRLHNSARFKNHTRSATRMEINLLRVFVTSCEIQNW